MFLSFLMRCFFIFCDVISLPGTIINIYIYISHQTGKNSPIFTKMLPNSLIGGYIGLSPFPVIVTTRIASCLAGDSYKPSFATITGKGDNPRDIYVSSQDGNATISGS